MEELNLAMANALNEAVEIFAGFHSVPYSLNISLHDCSKGTKERLQQQLKNGQVNFI
jgi:hypothetical protein